MSDFKYYIQLIGKELGKYGKMNQDPASSDQLERLTKASEEALFYTVPKEYLQLLSIVNGSFYNDVQIYSTETVKIKGEERYNINGFVEANLMWRDYEPNKEYIFFAETGSILYAHNITEDRYEIVDRVTNDPDEIVDSINELLEKALKHTLGIYD